MPSIKNKAPLPLSVNDILGIQSHFDLCPYLADAPKITNVHLIISKPTLPIKHVINSPLPDLTDLEKWQAVRLKIQNFVESLFKDPFMPIQLKKFELEFAVCMLRKDWNKVVKKWHETMAREINKMDGKTSPYESPLHTTVFASILNEDLQTELQLKECVKKSVSNFSQLDPEKNTVFNRYRQIACIILNKDFQNLYNKNKSRMLNNILDEALKKI